MTNDLLLNVTDLHAGYGRAEVLHGLNLRARAGSVVTVIGPNGAGKSTLLNALMGVLPSRGSIAYQGRSVVLDTLEERVMLGMALVPETRALFGTIEAQHSRGHAARAAQVAPERNVLEHRHARNHLDVLKGARHTSLGAGS